MTIKIFESIKAARNALQPEFEQNYLTWRDEAIREDALNATTGAAVTAPPELGTGTSCHELL